ncbi:SCO family protein [Larkinella terrae]|uniref:SCO family protein n=1 Tax=Larkinella terrae TaxID=2025311 RepID=A0A7K0EJM4_9BACT|nr:SCO family protein [Larkinella terrae]MRS62060.1 SCO family protein [Larkinella terrae]
MYSALQKCFPVVGLVLLAACSSSENRLPIFGERDVITKEVDGKTVTDTAYYQVPAFQYVNQDSLPVSDKTFEGKIYVTDFFFVSCPTICPKMKTQMKRVYEQFKSNPDVMILSYTIDPAHDTPAVLKEFAKNLGVTGNQWQFATGKKEDIFKTGKSYMVVAQEDAGAPGGLLHSGHFVLVDKEKHVRGMYDGTTEAGADKLMADIDKLLAEYKK